MRLGFGAVQATKCFMKIGKNQKTL